MIPTPRLDRLTRWRIRRHVRAGRLVKAQLIILRWLGRSDRLDATRNP